MLLYDLRQTLTAMHQELTAHQLVAWTSGNISVRDPDSGYIVIKPSGIRYPELTPEKMVVVRQDGAIIDGELRPSVDTESHLYIYRMRSDVGGIVHTHSPFATAFAVVGKAIPVALTAMADQFGGPIPCSQYAEVGGEAIGEEVLNTIGDGKAVLLKNHGVFTIGCDGWDALKSAVMVEESAKTLIYAAQLGDISELPKEEIERAYLQYKNHYGQAYAQSPR